MHGKSLKDVLITMAYISAINHSIAFGSLSQGDKKIPTKNETKYECPPFKRQMYNLNWIMTWQYMVLFF